MKMKKRRFENFSFYDQDGIAAHLENMAEKGWMLKKINRITWEYTKIEPTKLAFAVTYFSEASEFNPDLTLNQQTFHDYCREAGWNFVAGWAQMQIFYSSSPNPLPLETQEDVKLKNVHASMKKNFLPSSILLILLGFLQEWMQLSQFFKTPSQWLSRGPSVLAALLWLLLIILFIFQLTEYTVWYFGSRKSISQGGPCLKGWSIHKPVIKCLSIIFIIMSLLTVWTAFIQTSEHCLFFLLGFGYVLVVLFLALGIMTFLKKRKMPAMLNRILTFSSIVLLSVLLLIGITVWVFSSDHGTSSSDAELPLRIEDLAPVSWDFYSTRMDVSYSPVASRLSCSQWSFPSPEGKIDPNAFDLEYELLELQIPFFYRLCLKEHLEKYDSWDLDYQFIEIQGTETDIWQADAVYRLSRNGELLNQYLICQGSKLLYLNTDIELTEAQILTIKERLGI